MSNGIVLDLPFPRYGNIRDFSKARAMPVLENATYGGAFRNGPFGLEFFTANSTDDRIEISLKSSQSNLTNTTVCMLMSLSAVANTRKLMWIGNGWPNCRLFMEYISSGSLIAIYTPHFGSSDGRWTFPAPADGYHTMVMDFIGVGSTTNPTMMIDGKYVTCTETNTPSTNLQSDNNLLTLLNEYDQSQSWAGSMALFRMYNRQLSDAQKIRFCQNPFEIYKKLSFPFPKSTASASQIKKMSSIVQANFKKVASITEANIKKIVGVVN